MAAHSDTLHLPYSAPIDAYGNGGFRFAEMSHRGSLLCLPDGIWAWPPETAREIDEMSLKRVFANASGIDTLLIGTGIDMHPVPIALRTALRQAGIGCDVMQTGPAARIYNIMVGERRRVAAALIVVP